MGVGEGVAVPPGDGEGLGDVKGEETRGGVDSEEGDDCSAVAVGPGVAVAERCGGREGLFESLAPVVDTVCWFDGLFASCPPEGVGTGQKTSRPYRQRIIAPT